MPPENIATPVSWDGSTALNAQLLARIRITSGWRQAETEAVACDDPAVSQNMECLALRLLPLPLPLPLLLCAVVS